MPRKLKVMFNSIFVKQEKHRAKKRKAAADQMGPVAISVLALIFIGMLGLSSLNDYLFFDRLAMGSLIVFALVGIHLLGKQQVKRN